MRPAQDAMRRILAAPSAVTGADMIAWPGCMPCVSNVTGRPFESREALKELVARNCVETVQWWSSVRYLDQQERVRRWVGLGPGKVGRNLVGKEVGMKGKVKGGGVWAITLPKEIDEVLRGLEETEMAEEED
jgi:[acyl-carrier-protein] S-malonyltransferase